MKARAYGGRTYAQYPTAHALWLDANGPLYGPDDSSVVRTVVRPVSLGLVMPMEGPAASAEGAEKGEKLRELLVSGSRDHARQAEELADQLGIQLLQVLLPVRANVYYPEREAVVPENADLGPAQLRAISMLIGHAEMRASEDPAFKTFDSSFIYL